MEPEFLEGFEPNLEGFFNDSGIRVPPRPICYAVGNKSISTTIMTSALSSPDFKSLYVFLIKAIGLVSKDTSRKNGARKKLPPFRINFRNINCNQISDFRLFKAFL